MENEAEELMLYLTRRILLAICLTVLSAVPFVAAQEKPPILRPNQPVTFSLEPGSKKSFALQMKEDDFAEITWLAKEGVILSFDIDDSKGKMHKNVSSDDWDGESVLFVAPREDEYTLSVKFDTSSETKERQSISIELDNRFKLPVGSKQKDIRIINGYSVRIMATPDNNIVLIGRNGRLKYVMKSDGGSDYVGFSFADRLIPGVKVEEKRQAALVSSTLDKTGDGIPDVMIDHFSEGAHCCFRSYFINFGGTSRIG